MLCDYCSNLVQQVIKNNKLLLVCTSCGKEYTPLNDNTTILNEEKKSYIFYNKTGKTIFYYPANQKLFYKCPRCNKDIVSYELNKQYKKVYGCSCGHIWLENIV